MESNTTSYHLHLDATDANTIALGKKSGYHILRVIALHNSGLLPKQTHNRWFRP